MADDIVAFGGPERTSKRDLEDAIESLFRSYYPRLMRAAFSLVGDRDRAEQLTQEAYLRLSRCWRRRIISDPQAALLYLQDAIAQLSRETACSRVIGLRPRRTASTRRLGAAADGDEEIDTDRAWLSFIALRSRSATNRRRGLLVATAGLGMVAIVVLAQAGRHHATQTHRQPIVGTSSPLLLRTYPGAIAARIPMSGVMAVVGDAGHVWVVRALEQPGVTTTYQLAGIDLRTNLIKFRTGLGPAPRSIAAGAGRLWLTTSSGQADGQIVRVDLATGQIISTIHIAAGPCTAISFSSAHLFASCNVGGARRNAIWRINPVTQQVFRLTGTLHGYISSLTAAPRGLWYVVDFSRIAGLTNTGGNPQPVTARDPGYYLPPGGQGMVYDSGSIWVLSGGERLTQIDALNGRVMQVFTYRNYDPSQAGGLNFLAAGGGWLWFLDNGYPFSGVLRVGETTARPAGGVAIAPNSCGQQICSQIFYTPGSVWVPTAELLLRIDTSRLPS